MKGFVSVPSSAVLLRCVQRTFPVVCSEVVLEHAEVVAFAATCMDSVMEREDNGQ